MGNSTLPLGGGDATRISEIILQPGHGFVAGNVVRADADNLGEYVLAQADTAANAEAVGIVETVAGDSFDVVYQGRVDLSAVVWTDPLTFTLPTNQVWFLSTIPGELTKTPPTAAGSVIKAMLVVTDDTAAAESGILTGYVGVQIGGDNKVDINEIQPVGGIMPWAAPAVTPVPVGWALCDGQAISRTTFVDLFNVIGTDYGVGDGATTFNVPDLQRRVPVGQDASPPFDSVANAGGAETHTLTLSELPSSADHNHQHDSETTAELNLGTGIDVPLVQDGAGSTTTPEGSTEPGGGDVPFSILQPYLVINFIIRTIQQAAATLLDHNLSQHSDVGDVSNPVDCDLLKFNATPDLPDFPNGKWEAAAPTLGDGGRNRLINGNFSIWQRETDFVAPAGAIPADSGFYTADRWRWQFSGDGGTFDLTPGASFVEQATFDPGQPEVPDNSTFYMKWRGAFIGIVNGDEELSMTQLIENARTLAGQKATLSFWAKGDSAGTILVSTRQNLGLGGDVSDLPIFAPVALTTSWKKFVVVLDVQSIAGKTLGGSDQYLSLRFTSILGADVAALTGSITVNYTDTISLANVQFEAGSTETAFEIRKLETEIGLCQRYYSKAHDITTAPFNMSAVPGVQDASQNNTPGIYETHSDINSGGNTATMNFPVRMRAAPSLLVVQVQPSNGPTAVQSLTANFVGEGSVSWRSQNTLVAFLWTADAEL